MKIRLSRTTFSDLNLAVSLVALLAFGAGACQGESSRNDINLGRADAAAADVSTGAGTCRDLKNCRLACADDACNSACDAMVTPAAKAAYDAVIACVQANKCSTEICAERKCGVVLNTCLDRPASSGSLTCANVLDCALACGDSSCKTACLGKSSPGVEEAYGAVAVCAQANACADKACLEQKCGAPLDICLDREHD